MSQQEKIKVAWLCHFSNEQTRERLPLSKKRFFYNIIKKVTNKPKSTAKYNDFAPWVSNLIVEFEKFNDIELHVISPQTGLRGLTKEFELNGVFYHFYNPDFTLLLANLIKNVKLWLKLQPSSYFVKRYIKNINPDIINLIGAENFYHSCVVLDIKKIPIYVSCQTIYTNPNRMKYNPKAKSSKNWNIELLIHKKEKYFGCAGRMHRDLLLNNNSNSIVFKMFFPFKKANKVKEVPKVYDFVCFAANHGGSHGGSKGTKDVLEALYLVKGAKQDVTLNIVGRCDKEVKRELDKIIVKMDLRENVIFHDYFPVHSDMYQHIKQAKFAVLPVKMDVIPGTVIESILLEIPVITYKTTGTPYLNREKECILISDIGDINGLAENMINLLNSEATAKALASNAKEFVTRTFDNKATAFRFVETYKAIINNYHFNKPIPEELLFDVNEFPIYKS